MPRTCVVILFLFILGLLPGSPVFGSEVTGLKIRNKVFEPETRQLSYALWNESHKTITAWRLSLARSDRHGHAQKSILDQDFFDVAGSERPSRPGPLRPGESADGEWRLDVGSDEGGIKALSIRVVAVIFDDSTWQGDRRAAEAILEGREARIEEIGRILSSLEGDRERFRTREDWAANLKQRSKLLRQLGEDQESLTERRRETAAQVSATRLELAEWLDDASHEVSLAPNPAATMGHLTRALKRRYDHGREAVQRREAGSDSTARGNGGGQ